jgi:ABC-type uncharacterized transport system permease subunit
MTTTLSAPTVRLSPGRRRAFAILTGITTLSIFLQAVTAGQFVSQDNRDSWINIHGVIADAAWGFALITAIYAIVTMRRTHPLLTWMSVALFVLTLALTGIGHLISDLHQDGWIGIHIPLAFVVFGLTIWLSFRSARLRRAASARA